MADNDDDDDVTTIDVRGDDVEHPMHVRLRTMAFAMVHELDAEAVTIVVYRKRACVTSTMLHCSVAEAAHPEVGAGLIRGMQTCIGQLDDALIRGAGNAGTPPKGTH